MKPFKPNKDLISLLISRNLEVPKPAFATRMLDYENYYYVINGYKKLFINSTVPNDSYKPGSSFSEIVALYTFDRRLREILLTELLRVEHVIKSRIVYVFSESHGHNHTAYLRPESFNVNGFTNFKRTNSMIFDMLKLIDKQQKIHGAVKHYMDKYGYVPLWVLSKVMTFGKLNSFYACMLEEEKTKVAASFNLNSKNFKNLIDFLANLRNKCAHGERIYCHSKDTPKPRPIPALREHTLLKIPKNSSGHIYYGTHDILALLIALKYFVSPLIYDRLLKRIDFALHEKLKKRLHSIDITEVKRIMGLNCDWLKLK